MKLPFLHKSNSPNSSLWPWPSCHQQPRTLSFRTTNNTVFNSIDSSYLDATESACVKSSESASVSFSTAVSEDVSGSEEPESIEAVIEGLRSSQRLFFERNGETNSILEAANNINNNTKKHQEGFMLLSMESKDPYFDFKKSMEEMVEAHGLKDWESLEQLLCWYLKFNAKTNHGYIFGAFIDLLVDLALAEANNTTTVSGSSVTTTTSSPTTSCSCSNLRESPSSPLSFYASCSSDESCSVPCVSSLEAEENEDEEVIAKRASRLSSLLEAEDKIKAVAAEASVSC